MTKNDGTDTGVAAPVADGDVREPTMTLSLARKINTGNYESAEVFVSISGVRAGMTDADLEPLLNTGKIAYDALRRSLADKVNEIASDVEARLL